MMSRDVAVCYGVVVMVIVMLTVNMFLLLINHVIFVAAMSVNLVAKHVNLVALVTCCF